MLPKRGILAGLLITAIQLSSFLTAQANSNGKHVSEGDHFAAGFALDLAVTPESLDRLMANLKKLGVQAIGSASGRPAESRLHILVGPFSSAHAAAQCGTLLVARGLIGAFTIRYPDNSAEITRPGVPEPGSSTNGSALKSGALDTVLSSPAPAEADPSARPPSDLPIGDAAAVPLKTTAPKPGTRISDLAPEFGRATIPGADPVKLAMENISGVKAERNGGIWLAGDTREGFSRLQWIAGKGNAGLLTMAADGKVTLKRDVLIRLSGADRAGAGASFVITEYLKSNEGLYLLAQLMAAENRYCLYLGQKIPTGGDDVEIDGAINLDNNFDSRINTYRKDGMKLPRECPPEGFDSLVGINPAARWFNLRVRMMVPDGVIVFHELAEALAKVDYGLDYLPDGLKAGAHDLAVQREIKLKSQRPDPETVITMGSNVVFKSRDDFLKFKSEHQPTLVRR